MKADFNARLRIYEALQTVCSKDGDSAVYVPDESDATVAERLGVGKSQVASVRVAAFGQIKRTSQKSLPERIADLERRMAVLEKELGVKIA